MFWSQYGCTCISSKELKLYCLLAFHEGHIELTLFEILYNFSHNFVTLLSNTWFGVNKTLSVLIFGPLCM